MVQKFNLTGRIEANNGVTGAPRIGLSLYDVRDAVKKGLAEVGLVNKDSGRTVKISYKPNSTVYVPAGKIFPDKSKVNVSFWENAGKWYYSAANGGGAVVPPVIHIPRADREWSEEFVPQKYGSGGNVSGGKKPRTQANPVLYTAHLFTGFIPEIDELVVVFKTGKSDRFETERRKMARTFGLTVDTYETTPVEKAKQAKLEVDKRNALRADIRKSNKVYHFGECDAVVVSSRADETGVITSYFNAAKTAA